MGVTLTPGFAVWHNDPVRANKTIIFLGDGMADEAVPALKGLTPLQHALSDGEDFELLFTVPRAREPRLARAWLAKFATPCTRIGQITARCGRLEVREAGGRLRVLSGRGFEHFV